VWRVGKQIGIVSDPVITDVTGTPLPISLRAAHGGVIFVDERLGCSSGCEYGDRGNLTTVAAVAANAAQHHRAFDRLYQLDVVGPERLVADVHVTGFNPLPEGNALDIPPLAYVFESSIAH
jgi:hypothetical protein